MKWPSIQSSRFVSLQTFRERCSDLGVAFGEASIEVGKAQKGLNFCDVPRRGSFQNSFDFVGVHGDSLGQDDSQELDSFLLNSHFSILMESLAVRSLLST